MLKEYLEEKAYIKQQNRFYRLMIIILIFALFCSFGVTYYAIKNEKVVLVPMSLSREVSVSEKNLDPFYLEEVVKYISYLAFNYTPETIDWQVNVLLRYFAPEVYSNYKQILYKLVEDVKAAKVSSLFVVSDIKVNPQKRKILVSGTLQQWTREKVFIANEMRRYILGYDIKFGRFYLTELKECKDQECNI